MGLAASQARLLTLTARKADCEFSISRNSLEKMALTREQSNLSREYYSKLSAKKLAYYYNGRYRKLDYKYLMGQGSSGYSYVHNLATGDAVTRNNTQMILTDSRGLVVISGGYERSFERAGLEVGSDGRGSTFSADMIPELIRCIAGYPHVDKKGNNYTELIKAVIEGGSVTKTYSAERVNTLSGEVVGQTTVETDAMTSTVQKNIEAMVSLYYPLLMAAANNGWTTEYNTEMENNEDYIGDALLSGTFQLALVADDGGYNPDTTLSYFTTADLITERTDSDMREEITAWYNAEKDRIAEKENFLDLNMTDLSTELESIKTEMESIKTFIDDAIQTVFDWGSA